MRNKVALFTKGGFAQVTLKGLGVVMDALVPYQGALLRKGFVTALASKRLLP
jgi:hypothetical protein